MAENEVVEVEPKGKKRIPKFFVYLEIIGPVFITYSLYSIRSPQSTVRSPRFILSDFITWSSNHIANSLCQFFSSSVSRSRSRGFLPYILLTLGQTCTYCEALRRWIGRDQFLAVETFFHVFVPTVSPPFFLFFTTFSPNYIISEFIDLARRVKFNR